MANILTAAASAAKERIKSTAEDVKDSVVNQFDPRQSIYQLGLGVGPLIRQTVAEMKKQQNKESKNADKGAKKDIGEIKRDTTKNAKSLEKAAMHLGSIDKSLKEIRKINNVQLQAQMKMVRAERITAGATTGADLMSIFKSSKSNDDAKSTGPQKDDEEGGTLSTIAKIGAGLAIGGVLWSNRAEIKKFLDQFLEGAGLPSTEKLADQAGKAVVGATKQVAVMVGGAIIDGVTAAIVGLPSMIYQHIKEALGLGTDDKGNKLPANQKPLGADIGALGGAAAGYKYGGKTGAVFGAITGGVLGYSNPELALLAGAAFAPGAAKGVKNAYTNARARFTGTPAPSGVTPTAPVAISAVPASQPQITPDDLTRKQRRAMEMEKRAEFEQQGMSKADAKAASQKYMRDAYYPPGTVPGTTPNGVPSTGGTVPTEAPSSLADKAKFLVKDALNAKNILKRGAVGGLISGFMEYQETGNIGDALVTASLSTIGAGIGLAFGGVGAFAGGLLGEQAAKVVNKWRHGGDSGDKTSNAPGGPSGAVTPSSSPAGSTAKREGYGNAMTVMKGSKGRFGEKRNGHIHAGVDIGGNRGDPVLALKDGTVVFAGTMSGYGNTVDIKYDDGTGSRMAHLDSILVKQGDKVKKGQKVGTVGSSGLEDQDAVHLHLEIYDENGRAIDPRSVLNLPAYTGKDDGGTYAVNKMFTPGGGGGDGGGGAGFDSSGFSTAAAGSPVDVQALKSMGVSDDQIKAITENQKYLGEMGDLASILPGLLGGDIGQMGNGGGSAPQTPARPRGQGGASKPDAGSVNSPEKTALQDYTNYNYF